MKTHRMATYSLAAASVLAAAAILVSCGKDPVAVPVSSLTLGETSISLNEGETKTLSVSVSPETADNKLVIWSTSNASVARVSSGEVTAVKAGNAVITAKSDDGGRTAVCNVSVSALRISVESLSLDCSSIEIMEGEQAKVRAVVKPDNATDRKVLWTSSDENIATVKNGKISALHPGIVTVTAETEDGGFTASCEVTVLALPEIVPVDLGLSVRWASWNVGAMAPEEPGGFFAWGETQGKKGFSWDTYLWGDGSTGALTKYTGSDKTVLDPEDDPAAVRFGEGWRMPTLQECEELMSNCIISFGNSENNGARGFILTSKKNGERLFFPAAGCYKGNTLKQPGSVCVFWTSTLSAESPACAKAVSLTQEFYYYDFIQDEERCMGLTVRPVIE
ncbi:MAG: Ig domain-containing protein [Bacteroidales bacterium]|nr:Ig domain-containing protein [Bacteroidales bacterium]